MLLLLLPIQLFCQQNKELKSSNDIDSILVGTWKLKGSNTDSQFIFTTTNENEITCKIYQYFDEAEASSSSIHETKVDVIEHESGYELKWDYPKFYWKGKIEKLKPRRLIVEINGKPFNPNSTVQLRSLLFDYLGLQPTGKKTGTGADSARASSAAAPQPRRRRCTTCCARSAACAESSAPTPSRRPPPCVPRAPSPRRQSSRLTMPP